MADNWRKMEYRRELNQINEKVRHSQSIVHRQEALIKRQSIANRYNQALKSAGVDSKYYTVNKHPTTDHVTKLSSPNSGKQSSAVEAKDLNNDQEVGYNIGS